MGKIKRVNKAHRKLCKYVNILVRLGVITGEDRTKLLTRIYYDFSLFMAVFTGKKIDKANALVILSARNSLWRMEPRDVL